jgi:ParB-like chromosome segregation protein Spo0J
VKHIANSIREFGFRQPIVVDADNVVVIGHGRLMAAKKLGFESVPVVRADDLTDEQIRALRLADNKTNESEWDFAELETELAELEMDFDMSEFGFDDIQGGVSETKDTPEVKLEEKYQLIVDCDDEDDMQQKYDVLQEAGIECRVSTL